MRNLLYVMIFLGIGYGVYSLIASGDDAEDGEGISASEDGRSGGDGADGGGAPGGGSDASGEGGAGEEAPPVAEVLEDARKLVVQANAAESRTAAHVLRDRARRLLGEALLTARDDEEVSALKAKIKTLNENVLKAEEEIPGKSFLYTFKPTDRLWNLCRKGFPGGQKPRVAPGFLLWMNGLSDARNIQEGQILKITTEDLSLRVVKSRFELWVLLGGVYVREFPVGLGVRDKTPEGRFEIATRIKEPDWYRDGRKIPYGHPDNRLGTRWLGFKRTPRGAGYGIHGTDDPTSIGKEVSEGCVRLRNADVEELFEWVQVGTQVQIVR